MGDEWDKRFSFVSSWAGKGIILLKIAQYVTILLNITKKYYIEILLFKMESSSARVVILSMGKTF